MYLFNLVNIKIYLKKMYLFICIFGFSPEKRKEPPDTSDTKPTSSDHLLVNTIVNSPPNNSTIIKNSKRPRQ